MTPWLLDISRTWPLPSVALFQATSRVRSQSRTSGNSTPRENGDEADPLFSLAADIKALVEEQGATFSSSVTDQCTHLITTQKDAEKKGTKCEN